MIGIKDVARKAGVSISTVSNVINDKKPVTKELKDKVNEAINELQYEVNPVGRGLKSNVTNQIGVIVPSFGQVYFQGILKGINSAANQYGYNIVVFETNGDIEKEKKQVKILQSSYADGIIIASSANTDKTSGSLYFKTLAECKNRKKRIPVVTLESVLDEKIDSVVVDNIKVGEIAVRHLIELGHKDIAHIAAPLRMPTGNRRFLGYKKALEEAGLKYEEALLCEGDFNPLSGYESVIRLMKRNKPFSAIFVGNDQMAIGAIRALLDNSFKIPQDVAVIGVDNNFTSSLIEPGLSSVSLPKHQMGFQALELIHNKIKNPDQSTTIIKLEADLVIRKSTDETAKTDWNLENW